ncbi:hypothetical protein C9890_0546 [Perkinsus sp. BL_2016]|nr:hypothetical protein C9890_0546 [Perkinsus sp. BL_2016]
MTTCNSYCSDFVSGSNCQLWLPIPLCQGTDVRCGYDSCRVNSRPSRQIVAKSATSSHSVTLTRIIVSGSYPTSTPTSPTMMTTIIPEGSATNSHSADLTQIVVDGPHPGSTTTTTASSETTPEAPMSVSVVPITSQDPTATASTTESEAPMSVSAVPISSSDPSMAYVSVAESTEDIADSDPLENCISRAESDENIFLWAEWPSIPSEANSWINYYSSMASFIDGNCARLKVTRLILRVTDPLKGAWWPPLDSPMYTSLLRNIPEETEVYVYPYVMDQWNQDQWTCFSPSNTSVLEGAFEFAKRWNDFLTQQTSSLRFVGIVLDAEEFSGGRNPEFRAQLLNSTQLKQKYSLKLGLSLGYQSGPQMAAWDSVVDAFYLQFYDYYYTPYVDATADSPFLLYLNDPASLVGFTLDTVLEGKSEDQTKYGPKVSVMWSMQNLGTGCIFPLNDGSCGVNFEFGAGWSAQAFNEYLKEFRMRSPNLGYKPQGIFQYSFLPQSWFLT